MQTVSRLGRQRSIIPGKGGPLKKKVIAKKKKTKKGSERKVLKLKKKGKGYIIIINHYIQELGQGSGACILSLVFLFSRYFWFLRERPSEKHAEWSTDHLSDSLHIWLTYAP